MSLALRLILLFTKVLFLFNSDIFLKPRLLAPMMDKYNLIDPHYFAFVATALDVVEESSKTPPCFSFAVVGGVAVQLWKSFYATERGSRSLEEIADLRNQLRTTADLDVRITAPSSTIRETMQLLHGLSTVVDKQEYEFSVSRKASKKPRVDIETLQDSYSVLWNMPSDNSSRQKFQTELETAESLNLRLYDSKLSAWVIRPHFIIAAKAQRWREKDKEDVASLIHSMIAHHEDPQLYSVRKLLNNPAQYAQMIDGLDDVGVLAEIRARGYKVPVIVKG